MLSAVSLCTCLARCMSNISYLFLVQTAFHRQHFKEMWVKQTSQMSHLMTMKTNTNDKNQEEEQKNTRSHKDAVYSSTPMKTNKFTFGGVSLGDSFASSVTSEETPGAGLLCSCLENRRTT